MKKNVLLFEKQENLRRLYEVMLSKDFRVSTASTPLEVLARVKMGQVPEAIVAHFYNEVTDDADAFLQLYQRTGYISSIPLFLFAPAQVGRFKDVLTETPLYVVQDATQLTSMLRNYFYNKTLAPAKSEKIFQPFAVPSWS